MLGEIPGNKFVLICNLEHVLTKESIVINYSYSYLDVLLF